MRTILCYGDSNTYGYNPKDGSRFTEDIRWTGRLQSLLGSDYKIIEEGCNGRTTVFDDPTEPWKNGLGYLRPCLNTHKPIDIVILMLGSNDLKKVLHLSAKQIADGAGQLVDVITDFTVNKQGFKPVIILVSPPEIGEGITTSPFAAGFDYDAVIRSRQFALLYKSVAEEKECIFLDAAKYTKTSKYDSLHLSEEDHKELAEQLYRVIIRLYSGNKTNSPDITQSYYHDNFQEFFDSTVNADVTPLYERFLRYVPINGHILDLGCGSGRDARFFAKKGYYIEAIDDCEELCSLAARYSGIDVKCMDFNSIESENCYDAIWACASLLHVSSYELPSVITRLCKSLRHNGILYMSFKYGNFEGVRDKRFFLDMTEEKFHKILEQIPKVKLIEEWQSTDERRGKDVDWYNAIVERSNTDE